MLCDRRDFQPLPSLQLANIGQIESWLPALVDALGLGSSNAFEVALPTQVGLEHSEHARRVKERLCGG